MNLPIITLFFTATLLIISSGAASAQATPSAKQIYKQLDRAASAKRVAPSGRISTERLIRSRKIRRSLPSVNISSINFDFGSAEIAANQRWKVRNIADALLRFKRRGGERFLIEGHTDAVGSRANNQVLSERRANSIKRALVQWFGVPRRMMITAGYGEDFLLVRTQRPERRNRRVTIRRATSVLR